MAWRRWNYYACTHVVYTWHYHTSYTYAYALARRTIIYAQIILFSPFDIWKKKGDVCMGIFSLLDAEWFFSCALVFGVRHGEGSVLFGKEFFSATQEGIDSVIVVDAVWCVCDAQMRMRTDFDRDAKLFRFQYYNIYLHSLLYTTQDRFGFIRVSVLLSSFSSAHWIWRRDCDVAMNDTACTHTRMP